MKHYGLIGNPVSQSLSEKYFTDKFTLEGIDARFDRFLLKEIHGLPTLLDAYPQLEGLSVTSPFKQSVIQYCDELDSIAAEVKAVNTLKICRKRGQLSITGYNTDIDGFAIALMPIIGRKKPDALILGSGGAARAVAFALGKMGIRFKVVSRKSFAGLLSYHDLDSKLIRSHSLIINATPLGMGKHMREAPPVPYQYLGSDHILFDLIYNPAETVFMAKGKEQEAKVVNGLLMLQAQAEKAWMIWNQ